MIGYKFTYKSPEPEFITRCVIRDKNALLKALGIMKDLTLADLRTSNKHSVAYYNFTESLFDNFIARIKATPIMTIYDKWWSYAIKKDSKGITLSVTMLKKVSFRVTDDDEVYCRGLFSDGEYTVAKSLVNKLTVEEYAKKYGVEEVTVRQWIRRGKLRSAEKIGNEWRIPESTDIPKRGYETGNFSINIDYYQKREGIPEDYAFLRNADNVTIFQNTEDKNHFTVMYDGGFDLDYHTIEMDSKEREKLELFLISTPYFHYTDRFTGGTYSCSTIGGDSLSSYLNDQVTLEDLQKTGPGIVAEDQFHLDMALDGFVIDGDKVWFEAK